VSGIWSYTTVRFLNGMQLCGYGLCARLRHGDREDGSEWIRLRDSHVCVLLTYRIPR